MWNKLTLNHIEILSEVKNGNMELHRRKQWKQGWKIVKLTSFLCFHRIVTHNWNRLNKSVSNLWKFSVWFLSSNVPTKFDELLFFNQNASIWWDSELISINKFVWTIVCIARIHLFSKCMSSLSLPMSCTCGVWMEWIILKWEKQTNHQEIFLLTKKIACIKIKGNLFSYYYAMWLFLLFNPYTLV